MNKRPHSPRNDDDNPPAQPRVQRRLVERNGNIVFENLSPAKIAQQAEEEHRHNQITGALIFSNHPTDANLRASSRQILVSYGINVSTNSSHHNSIERASDEEASASPASTDLSDVSTEIDETNDTPSASLSQNNNEIIPVTAQNSPSSANRFGIANGFQNVSHNRQGSPTNGNDNVPRPSATPK